MMRSLFHWTLLALAFGATAPAQAQGYALIGAWRCYGGQAVHDMVFNADGSYSGTYAAPDGFRAYSEGPYRLTGALLRIDYQVWETQPQPTPSPGGDTYQVQLRGGAAMVLLNSRCAPNRECQLRCERQQ